MAEAALVSRPLYGIGTVARLTGLKADTLRVWERRYQLGPSCKSPTGRRQYTQADLEHLQLLAALLAEGARIGEIAGSDRKTLERLAERGASARRQVEQVSARALFLGTELCQWLEEHQGCLSGLNAQLAAAPFETVDLELVAGSGPVDLLAVSCERLGAVKGQHLLRLQEALNPTQVLVFQRAPGRSRRADSAVQGITLLQFPPELGAFSAHLSRCAASPALRQGVSSMAELAAPRPRLFEGEALDSLRRTAGDGSGRCRRQAAALIEQLAAFETDTAGQPVENWQEAGMQSCVYAYTSQARWLMEKALDTLLLVEAEPSHEPAAGARGRQRLQRSE